MAAKIIPVILCGGGGTRLWPVSRESLPKQFVPLIGPGVSQMEIRESHPGLARIPTRVRQHPTALPQYSIRSWTRICAVPPRTKRNRSASGSCDVARGGVRKRPFHRHFFPNAIPLLIGRGSTFQQVMTRISDVELFARPIVITNSEFRFVVAEQLRDCAISADIVLEPSRRDSGPAVAIATALASERDPQALVLVLAADHIIRKLPDFLEACRRAAQIAALGRIVTFGIQPTYAATSYGYIRPGARLNGAFVQEVDAFVEKPDAETARKYVADQYLWNSGNFLFSCNNVGRDVSRGLNPSAANSSFSPVGCNGR
jgi:mannose-1-phosphate guanylyltransferase